MATMINSLWPSPAEYEFLRQLVCQHSQIHLGTDKGEMVRQRLQGRLKAIGLNNFPDYCDFLKSPDGADELTELMDVISTTVTSVYLLPPPAGRKAAPHRTHV
jgi:chemotaxis protein methyltransferase CheR